MLQRSRAYIPVVSRTCDDVNIQLDRVSQLLYSFMCALIMRFSLLNKHLLVYL